MIVRRRWTAVPTTLALAALLASAAPASALAGCTSAKVVSASVATSTLGPAGNFPSCHPNLACGSANGCWIRLHGTVSGAGVVSLEVLTSETQPVDCGPALRTCSVSTPMFLAPPEGVNAVCQAMTSVAVRAEVLCTVEQVA